jgi:hypothetical protein
LIGLPYQMEGQLRRKGHSDEPEWQSLGENANATFEHYKGSGTSPDHKAYSRMEMSGKDNQIRKQEINLGSLQLSSILYLYFCTFHISLTGQSLPRHTGPFMAPTYEVVWLPGSLAGLSLNLLTSISSCSDRVCKRPLGDATRARSQNANVAISPSLLGSPRPSCCLLALAASRTPRLCSSN